MSQGAVRALSVIAGLGLVTLSACGSSDSSGAGSGKGPIVIGLLSEASGPFAGPQLEEFGNGFEAAVKYVDKEKGGFGDRKVKIIKCDTKSTSAGAVNCANVMVKNKVAFVAGLSIFAGVTGLPILEKAGIPYQGIGASAQESISDDSISLISGVATVYPALGLYATKQLKSTRGSLMEVQLPQQAAKIVEPYYKKAGGSLNDVVIPATTADMTPSAANALLSKPDLIIQTFPNGQASQLYSSLFQQGFSPDRTLGANGNNDVREFFSKVKPAGAVKGAIVATFFTPFDLTSDPEVSEYLAAMKRYGTTDGRAEFTQAGFSAFMTDFAAAKAIGFDKVTSASILKYFHTETFPIFMGKEYSRASAPKGYPALGNPYTRFVQWDGSKIVDLSKGWTNAFTGEFSQD